ncbi:MAG TPA: hypothetical protein VFQ26_02945 [Nitrospiraceae bacterium]|nr:hypothetical protein [Nitrospiraceae bacterium]
MTTRRERDYDKAMDRLLDRDDAARAMLAALQAVTSGSTDVAAYIKGQAYVHLRADSLAIVREAIAEAEKAGIKPKD